MDTYNIGSDDEEVIYEGENSYLPSRDPRLQALKNCEDADDDHNEQHTTTAPILRRRRMPQVRSTLTDTKSMRASLSDTDDYDDAVIMKTHADIMRKLKAKRDRKCQQFDNLDDLTQYWDDCKQQYKEQKKKIKQWHNSLNDRYNVLKEHMNKIVEMANNGDKSEEKKTEDILFVIEALKLRRRLFGQDQANNKVHLQTEFDNMRLQTSRRLFSQSAQAAYINSRNLERELNAMDTKYKKLFDDDGYIKKTFRELYSTLATSSQQQTALKEFNRRWQRYDRDISEVIEKYLKQCNTFYDIRLYIVDTKFMKQEKLVLECLNYMSNTYV